MTASQLFFCYASKANVDTYAKPGAIFIPGQGVRMDPVFQQARVRGAEVYPYIDVCEHHIRGAQDTEYFEFAGAPLWGNGRKSWYPLTDMRVGSEYVRRAVEYIAVNFMPHFDGAFLDVVGGQLWARANWDNWPEAEKAQWRAGMVDFVRQLDAKRRELKPWFKIVNNNTWDETTEGAQYVDGYCHELPPKGLGPYAQKMVGRSYGYLGQRRVFVIARGGEGKLWAEVQGVTHVTEIDTAAGDSYLRADPPIVEAVDNRLAEAQAMREWLHTQRANGDIATQAQVASLKEQLTESRETNRLLGDRVDLLTAKIRAMAAFNAEQAEGIE